MTGCQEVVRWLLSVLHSTLTSLPPSQLSSLSAEVHSLQAGYELGPIRDPFIGSKTLTSQLVCLHVATGTSAAFTAGLLSAEETMGYVRLLADLATMAPTVCVRVSVCCLYILQVAL